MRALRDEKAGLPEKAAAGEPIWLRSKKNAGENLDRAKVKRDCELAKYIRNFLQAKKQSNRTIAWIGIVSCIPGLKTSHRCVALRIALRVNAKLGYSFPSFLLLREETGIKTDDTVSEAVTALEAAGLLSIDRRDGQTSFLYRLVLSAAVIAQYGSAGRQRLSDDPPEKSGVQPASNPSKNPRKNSDEAPRIPASKPRKTRGEQNKGNNTKEGVGSKAHPPTNLTVDVSDQGRPAAYAPAAWDAGEELPLDWFPPMSDEELEQAAADHLATHHDADGVDLSKYRYLTDLGRKPISASGRFQRRRFRDSSSERGAWRWAATNLAISNGRRSSRIFPTSRAVYPVSMIAGS